MLKKKAQINIFDWYLEFLALIFLIIAIVMVNSIPSINLKFINIFISGLICGYILFKRKISFRTVFITTAWIIGLIIGSEQNWFLVSVVFLAATILIYKSLKNKWVNF